MIINAKKFKKHIDESEIKTKVIELARKIRLDYAEKNPIYLIVLNGAIIFAADLIRETSIPSSFISIKASSYKKSMTPEDNVEISGVLSEIKNRHVLIIEDIVDTGNTMFTLINYLEKFNPLSVKVATLFSKPAMRKVEVDIKYIGFEINPLFIVGYGLDYAEEGRYLKDIFVIDN